MTIPPAKTHAPRREDSKDLPSFAYVGHRSARHPAASKANGRTLHEIRIPEDRPGIARYRRCVSLINTQTRYRAVTLWRIRTSSRGEGKRIRIDAAIKTPGRSITIGNPFMNAAAQAAAIARTGRHAVATATRESALVRSQRAMTVSCVISTLSITSSRRPCRASSAPSRL